MAKKANKNAQPAGSCDLCWGFHESLLSPHLADANIIFLVEKLGGTAERLLRAEAAKHGLTPILVPLSQCRPLEIPKYAEIKRNREKVLYFILNALPGIPVVAFGLGASLAVGKCTDTSMVGKTLEIDGRLYAFTYSYNSYLDSRDKHVLAHITSTIQATVTPARVVSWREDWPDDGFEEIVVDVETTGKEFPWYGSKLVQVGIKKLGGGIFAFRPEALSQENKDELARSVKLVVGHNILFDLVHLAYCGISFPHARIHDTLISIKNAYPTETFYGLKPWAKRVYGFNHWDAWFSSHLGIDPQTKHEWEKLCEYNANDLIATELLYRDHRKYMPFNLEMDYLPYVLKMIMNGFHVDVAGLDALHEKVSAELKEAEDLARAEFGLGVDFNWNSPPQVLALLQRSIPNLKSTGEEVLVEYQDVAEVKQLLKIRDLVKLKGTGIEGLKKRIDSMGLVHSSYAVHGAETGRSSSSSPNLQNTDPRVRPMFVSQYRQGKLVHTDLSGIEYRLIGHASEDKNLLHIFNGGLDIHDEMYKFLFDEPPPDKKRRKKAKTANFCGVYGGGYWKFIISAELPDCAESRALYDKVGRRYPGVAAWKTRVISGLYRTGRVRNLFGRVRQFEYVDKNIEREAINWIIQSSGHDILKIYCMEINDQIAKAGLSRSLFVSEVHDSNTFDCPQEEFEQVKEIIESVGKNLNPLIFEMFGVVMKVPIFAEIEVMDKWA